MAFQPFGYTARMMAHLTLEEIEQVLVANLPKSGSYPPEGVVRGWVVDNWFCLWSSRRRNGPIVFGRIVQYGDVSIIRVRAGADLNYVVPFTGFLSLFALILLWRLLLGDTLSRQINDWLWLGGLTGFLLTLSHWRRFESDPLVTFLIDKLSPTRIEGFPH